MQSYVQQSLPIIRNCARPERLMEERVKIVSRSIVAADYLSTINLSTAEQWKYALNTFARPKGRATRVVYTEYDLPRPEIAPHDVIVDKDGIVWFSSSASKTSAARSKDRQVTEFAYPKHRKDSPTASLVARRCAGQSVARQHVPGSNRKVRSRQ